MRNTHIVWRLVVTLGIVAATAMAGGTKPDEIPGAIAASCGDSVVLMRPGSRAVDAFPTGPVGFLFPGPGGVLFAPDVLNGRTTIYDMKLGQVREVVDGVTMPRFGPWRDRYLVVGGNLLVVSYPERSFLLRMDGDFNRPWQVIQSPDTSSLLLLERYPSGDFASRLSAIDLVRRSVVMQREFAGDLRRMAVLGEVGLIVVVDATAGKIRMLDPVTFQDALELDVESKPADVAVFGGGRHLVVANGEGALSHWKFKQKRSKTKCKKLPDVAVGGRPLRLAVAPDDETVAVATDRGRVEVINPVTGDHLGGWDVEGELRDLIWFDPATPGPLIPVWSDRGGGPETLEKRW